jgi:hypothetical protein
MTLPKLGLNVARPPRTVTPPAQVSTSATPSRAAQSPVARPFETDAFQAAPTKPAPVALSAERLSTSSRIGRGPIAPPPPGGGLDSGNVK